MGLQKLTKKVNPTFQQLRAAREWLEWSRDDMAKVMGVTAQSIKLVETGQGSERMLNRMIETFADHGMTFSRRGSSEGINKSTPTTDTARNPKGDG